LNNRIYYIASIIKIVIWALITIFTYTSINVYEDTAIALILWFIGIFILARWVSFFLFLGWYKLLNKESTEQQTKDSYRLSLLFGIYCLINILLLIWGYRNKIRWILILVWFIALQIFLIEGTHAKPESK
jgi:hypothetical protein